jgi:hypothetical protein
MIDTLANNVSIQNIGSGMVEAHSLYDTSGEITYPSDVIPGIVYVIESKYQNNFVRTLCLCYLDAVESNIGIWYSSGFIFESSPS